MEQRAPLSSVLAALLLLLAAMPAMAQQVPDPLSSTGPGFVTKVTPSITADIAMLTGRNTTTFTASQILDAAFLVPPGSGAKNLDGLRGVVFAPADAGVNLLSGVSAYVISDATANLFGGFPAAVGLFSAVVARGNDAKVWGLNTLLSDTTTGAVSAGTGKSLWNEFDINISSPNTQAVALQIAGGSKVQPAAAYGVVLQPLDIGVSLLRDNKKDTKDAGSVAKWSAFLQANPGSTNVFAGISPKDGTGNNVKSQDISMGFYRSTGTFGNLILTASEGNGLELFSDIQSARSLTIYGLPGQTGGSVKVPDKGGFAINSRVVMYGDGTLFSTGSDTGFTVQNYSNASAATTIFGASFKLTTLPASAGAGGLYVCVDTSGALYKKAACP